MGLFSWPSLVEKEALKLAPLPEEMEKCPPLPRAPPQQVAAQPATPTRRDDRTKAKVRS